MTDGQDDKSKAGQGGQEGQKGQGQGGQDDKGKAGGGSGDQGGLTGDEKLLKEIKEDPDAILRILKSKREANEEARIYREKLEAIEKKQKEADEKALAEQGKFKELAEKTKKEKDDAEGKYKARLIRMALQNEAIKAGMIDQADVILAPLDKIKISDQYEVEGAQDAIEALKDSKPYLFTADGKPPVKDQDGKKPGLRDKITGANEGLTPDQRLDRYFEEKQRQRK